MTTKITCAFTLIALAAFFVSPASAGTAVTYTSPMQVSKQHGVHVATNVDRNAYGMYARSGVRADTNAPAATGGGSLGYNQKLLIW